MTEVIYREGSDESPQGEVEDSKQTSSDDSDESARPITAFVVLKLADGTIDVVSDIEELFPMKRIASIGEIRSMAHTVYSDAQAQITSNFVSVGLTNAMKQVSNNRIIQPTASTGSSNIPSKKVIR